jgi:hypothetical protein
MSICSNVLHLFKKENNFLILPNIWRQKTKKVGKNFSPSSSFCIVGSRIQNPRSGMKENQDPGFRINNPDPLYYYIKD